MDNIPITTTVDLTSIPEEIMQQAKAYAGLLQDMLAQEKGMSNFLAMYCALLLAGANLAIICMDRDDPRFPSLMGWSMAVLDDYSEQVRTKMQPSASEKVH